jgi:hypothetical protein
LISTATLAFRVKKAKIIQCGTKALDACVP